MLTMRTRLEGSPIPPAIDFSEELEKSADLVMQEIRGGIERGEDPDGAPFIPNAPDYASWKLKKLGHSKPLKASGKTLVSKSSYKTKKGKNRITIFLSSARHPKSDATISEIGEYNQFGTSRSPARRFFDISVRAEKRIFAMISDKIARIVRGGASSGNVSLANRISEQLRG